MKNLWNRATQRICEAFKGPRTKDTEFDMKVQEVKQAERGLLLVRQIFYSFDKNMIGFRSFCNEVNTGFRTSHQDNSPYTTISNEVCDLHQEMEALFLQFVSTN